MADPEPQCDFIPAECAALAMQAAILAKKCKIGQVKFGGLERKIGGIANRVIELRLELNEAAQCTLLALQEAYEAAGCPFPSVPGPPDPPDLTPCLEAVENVKTQVTGGLIDFLAPIMQITLDADLKPIRIVVP